MYMSGQDGHWQQFDTTCSLISVPRWHRHEFTGSENAACESRPGYVFLAQSLVCLDSVRVWLSC